MKYNKLDSVILNGSQMNEILDMFSAEPNKKTSLTRLFNEKLYLKKIVEYKKDIQVLRSNCFDLDLKLHRSDKRYSDYEKRINNLLKAVEESRIKQYENGETK